MGSWICRGSNRFDKLVGQISLGFSRNYVLWVMKKDPDLEFALSRNKRWTVNNQVKNIILRCPDQVVSISWLERKFKKLNRRCKALNWLKKYPCLYKVFSENDELYCQLTKRLMCLVEEEEALKEMQEPLYADRLAKLLMMSSNHRLEVHKINELKRNFGFPDDYVLRIVPKYPDIFRIINHTGRRNSMEIELISWNPDLAVSAIEKVAQREGRDPCFSCHLPSTWVKSWDRFKEFNSTPYISPYTSTKGIFEGSKEMDKRAVGLVHELLSLTLWRRASIMKLSHFRREFRLPDKLNELLLKHSGIFYVSNKYKLYTVLLREAYHGSELIDKDPLVIVKEKLGVLMQEGLHEYNRRHHSLNLEKQRKRGELLLRPPKQISQTDDAVEQDDKGGDLGGILDPEERRRFYKVLFEHDGL